MKLKVSLGQTVELVAVSVATVLVWNELARENTNHRAPLHFAELALVFSAPESGRKLLDCSAQLPLDQNPEPWPWRHP